MVRGKIVMKNERNDSKITVTLRAETHKNKTNAKEMNLDVPVNWFENF